MRNKFILVIIGLLIFLTGCARNDSNNKKEFAEPTKSNMADNDEFTIRDDILFDAHNDKFVFIEGKNMTVDGSNSRLELDIDNDNMNEVFEISLDTPNGTEINVYKNDIGVNLLNLFEVEDIEYVNAFDDAGFPNESYYFQLSAYDLDGDGIMEVIASVGDLSLDLTSVVFKVSDSNDFPFVRVGCIWGQRSMYVDEENHIISPYGSQGLFEEYIYEDGKFFSLVQ